MSEAKVNVRTRFHSNDTAEMRLNVAVLIIHQLQHDIASLTDKYESQNKELKMLETRLKEIRVSIESLLVDAE